MSAIRESCRQAWKLVRALSGDDAYERYLEHFNRRHPGAIPLDRGAFYRADLERRWKSANRCC